MIEKIDVQYEHFFLGLISKNQSKYIILAEGNERKSNQS